jgi:hypothetical protein
VQKGIIDVYEPHTTDSGRWTQFKFKDVGAVAGLVGETVG